jgi:hypothetical protein
MEIKMNSLNAERTKYWKQDRYATGTEILDTR